MSRDSAVGLLRREARLPPCPPRCPFLRRLFNRRQSFRRLLGMKAALVVAFNRLRRAAPVTARVASIASNPIHIKYRHTACLSTLKRRLVKALSLAHTAACDTRVRRGRAFPLLRYARARKKGVYVPTPARRSGNPAPIGLERRGEGRKVIPQTYPFLFPALSLCSLSNSSVS